eukprot:CAMPEP_0197015932 /NCGR_PEP_ID=MMETSP1380-20130617/76223_1 /TAXON_ID=5936 /ORGANISM="Euplotes crassus, Strain CT5" /LENGTH=165 /DNA_ID=CAMNT_0042442283 /DNA_START=449 /DNA_END=943 /DNA_ORIENTATION=-
MKISVINIEEKQFEEAFSSLQQCEQLSETLFRSSTNPKTPAILGLMARAKYESGVQIALHAPSTPSTSNSGPQSYKNCIKEAKEVLERALEAEERVNSKTSQYYKELFSFKEKICGKQDKSQRKGLKKDNPKKQTLLERYLPNNPLQVGIILATISVIGGTIYLA